MDLIIDNNDERVNPEEIEITLFCGCHYIDGKYLIELNKNKNNRSVNITSQGPIILRLPEVDEETEDNSSAGWSGAMLERILLTEISDEDKANFSIISDPTGKLSSHVLCFVTNRRVDIAKTGAKSAKWHNICEPICFFRVRDASLLWRLNHCNLAAVT